MALVSDYKYENAEIFSYFDQFMEYQVDLTPYLKNFSTSAHSLKFSNKQPNNITIRDIFTKVIVEIDYKKYASNFETYSIKDNEDIFSICYRKYNKIDYWWIIFVLNNIQDPLRDWPFMHEEVIKLASILYEKEGKYTLDAYYNLLFERNEKKRIIILPDMSTIREMLTQFNLLTRKF